MIRFLYLVVLTSLCIPGLEVRFQKHPPEYVSFGTYSLAIVGEAQRRGGERTVIVEDILGNRSTLATWDDSLGEVGMWVTANDQQWEDVRIIPTCHPIDF